MYENFYRLKSRPFQLTPDPQYYFESLTHRKALSYLGYGLAQGEGFIVITGEVGAGKTTLVRHLMATIDTDRLTAASIVTSAVDNAEIVMLCAHHFGIDTDGRDKGQILGDFESFLHSEARAGRRCLLIVDEAQNLPYNALEELRMLSNFQLGGQSLLQIFLLGQPEFRDSLQNNRSLEQLRQRVIAVHHLEAMTAEEIEPYITHRLSRAGWSGRPKITSDVFPLLYAETGGMPRKINMLMSRVLLMGAVEKTDHISQSLVGLVLADLRSDLPPPEPEAAKPAGGFAVPKGYGEDDTPAPEAYRAPPVAESPVRQKPAPTVANAVKSIAQVRAEAAMLQAENDRYGAGTPGQSGAQGQQWEAALAVQTAEIQRLNDRLSSLMQRIVTLEDRADQSDAHVHHMLSMLIEWVENDIRVRERHVKTGYAA